MKKNVYILAAATACIMLSACGGGGDLNENTDPASLETQKLEKEQWEEAFASEPSYCMKMSVTSSKTQNEGTMSEVTTINYCNDGERAYVSMTFKEGDTTRLEAESYADLSDEKTIWSRTKEDGEWSEWDSESYTSEQLAELFAGFSAPAFARDAYEAFSYSESENGYTMSEEELAKSTVNGYIESALSQTSVDIEELSAEKFVLKFTDGKPSACLIDLSAKADSEKTRETSPVPVPVPLPRIRITRHGRIPHIVIEIRPMPREVPLSPETPEFPAERISISQLFYNYGKARVTLPTDLPPLGEN